MEAKFLVRHYDYSVGGGGRRILPYTEEHTNIDDFFNYIGNKLKLRPKILLYRHTDEVMVEAQKINIFYTSQEDIDQHGRDSEPKLETKAGCSRYDCYWVSQINCSKGEVLTFDEFKQKLCERFPAETAPKPSLKVLMREDPPPEEQAIAPKDSRSSPKKREEDIATRQFRANLIADLQTYIDRIEGYNGNYADGFLFFSASRAINRQINYELAKYLRNQLKAGADIGVTFNDANLATAREKVTTDNNLHQRPDYVKRDINSSDLKAIIEDAHNCVEQARNKPNKS